MSSRHTRLRMRCAAHAAIAYCGSNWPSRPRPRVAVLLEPREQRAARDAELLRRARLVAAARLGRFEDAALLEGVDVGLQRAAGRPTLRAVELEIFLGDLVVADQRRAL